MMEAQSEFLDGLPTRRRRQTYYWVNIGVRLFKEKPLGMWGGAFVIILLIAIALLSPTFDPYPTSETHSAHRAESPSGEFIFGTDTYGRDVFSRVMEGSRVTLQIAIVSVAIGTAAAAIIGIVSGYLGSWLDTFIQRIVDVFMAFPAFVLLLALVSIFTPGKTTTIGVLAFYFTFGSSRIVRSAALATRETTYVDAARAVGAGDLRIMRAHILPNVMPVIVVVVSMNIGVAILAEAALSFLGFGVAPPTPDWGAMLADGRVLLATQPWLSVFPGVAITITVFAFNVLGDALRDILDPRLRNT